MEENSKNTIEQSMVSDRVNTIEMIESESRMEQLTCTSETNVRETDRHHETHSERHAAGINMDKMLYEGDRKPPCQTVRQQAMAHRMDGSSIQVPQKHKNTQERWWQLLPSFEQIMANLILLATIIASILLLVWVIAAKKKPTSVTQKQAYLMTLHIAFMTIATTLLVLSVMLHRIWKFRTMSIRTAHVLVVSTAVLFSVAGLVVVSSRSERLPHIATLHGLTGVYTLSFLYIQFVASGAIRLIPQWHRATAAFFASRHSLFGAAVASGMCFQMCSGTMESINASSRTIREWLPIAVVLILTMVPMLILQVLLRPRPRPHCVSTKFNGDRIVQQQDLEKAISRQ